MSDKRKQQIKAIMELNNLLTLSIIRNLEKAMNIPARIMEETENDPVKFVYALKDWESFDPSELDRALQTIGNKPLLHTARQLEWLSNPHYKQPASSHEMSSVKSLVQLLTNEMTSQEWTILVRTASEANVKDNIEVKEMMKLCIENNLITSDLTDFCESLEMLKRKDLAKKVGKYMKVFQGLTSAEFHKHLKNEISLETKANEKQWQLYLREFVRTQNKDVSVVLDDKTVPIETIYTPLTVVKVKPGEERVAEESGISEIDYLRNMHRKIEIESVQVVDFENIVTTCDPSLHELWCMIGSPGSGKSFLCKHYAHMYGTDQLPSFLYTVSIPCRSPEWHNLEEARHKGEKAVDSDFIVSWLSLSMYTGAKWSESLSEYLVKSDGEGLFIIIDGADEFTRNVPFESTLLNKLLERRFLSRSTILVTSRPSTWYDFKYVHGAQFQIDINFQVLGFSPENRDLYFAKRIETVDKLNAVHEMFERHDEIKQLSLVPVNASLFSALFNETDSILSQTLSHLYMQLIVYIIRRQLSRMGLKEHSKVLNMSDFHPGIRECIHAIGQEANQGIFERELTSDQNIFLKIGDKAFPSERLGLMQAHMKVLRLGIRVKVWTFQHLTIQEFMAALSICNNTWTNQCLIVRYITSSNQYMSMYKMVVRFVGGILRHDAGRITPILCRHTLPTPLPLREVPMHSQLYFNGAIVNMSDWREFTQSYILLTTAITEMNTESISDHFAYFKKDFPYPLYLYFKNTVSPNEWHCFLQSLRYIRDFQIIYIHSGFVTATQFGSLLGLLHSTNLHYFALVFVEEDFTTIYSYTSQLSSATLPPETRISVNFARCDLTACPPSQNLFPSTNQFAGSLKLNRSDINNELLRSLTNQFSSLENFHYRPKSNVDRINQVETIQLLALTHQLNGLYIDDDEGYLSVPHDILSGLSSLKELDWTTERDCYQVLPYLANLSSLTCLELLSSYASPPNESIRQPLTQLISTNSNSLREISLDELSRVGFHSWNSFFNCITSCSNLMTLRLTYTEFSSSEINSWYRAVSAMKSLVYLALLAIPLEDSGMLVVCHSLSYHPAMRRLFVKSCKLTSASCRPLICLIQTLPYMRLLELSESELSAPDPTQLQLLLQTAEECSIKIYLK